MCDFNVDLLHYKTYYQNREFVDRMFSAFLSLHITISMSQPIQQNISQLILFSQMALCGNLKCSTSDNLAQFLIYTSRSVVNNFDQKHE